MRDEGGWLGTTHRSAHSRPKRRAFSRRRRTDADVLRFVAGGDWIVRLGPGRPCASGDGSRAVAISARYGALRPPQTMGGRSLPGLRMMHRALLSAVAGTPRTER